MTPSYQDELDDRQVQDDSNRLNTAELILLLLASPLLLQPQLSWVAASGAAIALFTVWLTQRILYRQPLLPHTPLTTSLWLLLAFVTVGVIVSADPDLARPNGFGFLLGVAWWRVLTRQASLSQRRLISGVWVTLLAAVGLTTIALLTTRWNVKLPQLAPLIDSLATLSRFVPAALGETHPNRLASVAVQAFPLALLMALGPVGRRYERLLWAVGAALLGVALLLSQSRSGWLAVVITTGVVLLLLARFDQRRPWRLFFASVLMAGAVAAGVVLWRLPADFLAQLWTEPPRETVVGSLATFSFRLEIWRWALAAIGDFPVTGVGLASFPAVVHRLYPTLIPVSYVGAHAHNIFLQTALDVGVPGLVAYLALIFAASVMTWQLLRQQSQSATLALGAWGGLLALHVYGLTDALEIGAQPGIVLWLLLGLITAAYLNAR